MRKILFTLCLMLGAGWLVPPTAHAQKRTEADALTAAQGFLNRKHSKRLDASQLKVANLPLKGLAKTPAAADAAEGNAYYLVENVDNNDLVIVSGDYRMPEVLGYTNLRTSDEMPEGLLTMLDIYQEQFELVQNETLVNPFKAKSTAAAPIVKEKLLPTAEWGNKAPFNTLIPGGLSVPSPIVASAIIMNYHQWPAQGKGSVSYTNEDGTQFERDFSQSHYDWASIPYRFDEGGYSDTQADEVAKIMYDLSMGAEVQFLESASKYANSSVKSMYYKYFSYYPGISYHYSREIEDYVEEIDANRPVLYNAKTLSGSSSTAFVIDGYYNEFVHINWGSYGNYNGYYILYNPYKGDKNYQKSNYTFFQIEPDTLGDAYSTVVIQPNKANTYTGLIATHTDVKAGKPFGLYVSSLDYLTTFNNDSAAVVLCSAEGQVKDFLAYYALYYFNYDLYLSCTPTVDAAEGDYITLLGKSGSDTGWKPLRPMKEGGDRLPAIGYEPPHVQLETDVEAGLEIENLQPDLLYQGNPILHHPYVCTVKLPKGKDVATFQVDDRFYVPDSIVNGKLYYSNIYTTAGPHQLSIHTLARSEMINGLHFTLGQGRSLEEYISSVTDRPEKVAELTLEGPLICDDYNYLFQSLPYLCHLDLTNVYGEDNSYDITSYDALPLLFLTDFQLPKALKDVGLLASNHPMLERITFSADFQNSSIFSLEGSDALREINTYAVLPPTVKAGNPLPQQVAEEAVLHVPAGSKVEYEDADYWNQFRHIEEDLPALDVFFTVDGLDYEVELNADEPNEVSITGCTRTDALLEIPTEVEFGGKRYTVTGISSKAFYRVICDTIVLPASIRHLQKLAFFNTKSSFIQLNDEIETIPNNAFASCSNLHDIHWPKNLRTIGSYAFYNSALDSIMLPDKVVYVGDNAFANCMNVRRIHLSPVLEHIGELGFYCHVNSYLDSTVFPSTLKYLGDYSFFCMSFLDTDVVLPAALEYYGEEALSWNILCGIRVEEGCPALRSENGMLLDADNRRLHQYARPSSPVDLKVPEGVESIAMAVGYHFDNIKTLTLPSTLTLVKDAAFGKCSGLTDVTMMAVIPPVIESFNNYPFEDCYDKATLHVPAEALSYYQQNPFWNRFTHIEPIDPEAIHSIEAEAADTQSVIRVCGDRFNLQLAAESDVKVYDTAGRLVSSQRLAAGSHSIKLPAQGVYVVRTK